MSNRKISVITVCLNAEQYIEQCIASIINQSYENKEFIIIDGGSSDSTLDIIKKYTHKIDHFISEPDEGIADAMNKGIKLATGDYILFIHSDDYLLNANVLKQASEYLDKEIDVYMFQVIIDNLDKKKIANNNALGWWTNFKIASCHQGHLSSIKLFEKIGVFNPYFKIDMDYEFILRAYRNKASSLSIDLPISVMRLTGVSSKTDWPSLKKRFAEERKIHFKHCTSLWMKLLYATYWIFYLTYRKNRYLFTIVKNKISPCR